MINRILLILALITLGSVSLARAQGKDDPKGKTDSAPAADSAVVAPAATSKPVSDLPPVGYDPKADAAADIKAAVDEASSAGKRVFIEVGGEWCIWCHRMEEFINSHADLKKLRDDNFVTVKVNFSDDNKNQTVLGAYPPVAGYPHIFILGPDGAMLHSEDTSLIEDGKKSYDLDKFAAFLKEWKSPKR